MMSDDNLINGWNRKYISAHLDLYANTDLDALLTEWKNKMLGSTIATDITTVDDETDGEFDVDGKPVQTYPALLVSAEEVMELYVQMRRIYGMSQKEPHDKNNLNVLLHGLKQLEYAISDFAYLVNKELEK